MTELPGKHSSMLESELVFATPSVDLQHFVGAYGGVRESGAPVVRRWFPGPGVSVLIAFEQWPLTIDGVRADCHPGLVRGLSTRPVVTKHDGFAYGMLFILTPLGANLILGLSGQKLRDQILPLESVLGDGASKLARALADLPTWPERFELLEAWLRDRTASVSDQSPEISFAFQRLRDSGGRLPINTLLEELGCSQRHLSRRFSEVIGITPKVFGRVLRFDNAVSRLALGDDRLCDIAFDCGYYDQAHFNRDTLEFAGIPPKQILRERIVESTGFGRVGGHDPDGRAI